MESLVDLISHYLFRSRSEKTLKLASAPTITTVTPWDGKNASPPQAEAPLDEDWNKD